MIIHKITPSLDYNYWLSQRIGDFFFKLALCSISLPFPFKKFSTPHTEILFISGVHVRSRAHIVQSCASAHQINVQIGKKYYLGIFRYILHFYCLITIKTKPIIAKKIDDKSHIFRKIIASIRYRNLFLN